MGSENASADTDAAAPRGGQALSLRRRLRRGLAPSLLTVGVVTFAYQFPSKTVIDFRSPLQGALATRNFHDAEAGHRWSRGRSEIIFRAPGGNSRARLELVLSGFRPRGEPLPLVVVETPRQSFRLEPTRRIEPYELSVSTPGFVPSDFPIVLRSQVFSPGEGDDRVLGVRVHRATLSTPWFSAPPLKMLLLAGVLSIFLGRHSAERRSAWPPLVGWFLAFGFLRHWAALVLPVAAVAVATAWLVRAFVPALAAFVADWVSAGARIVRAGSPPAFQLLVAATAAAAFTLLAMLLRPVVELDLGSGEVTPIASRFAGFDRDDKGVRFREALAGASLDLRDFGAWRPWRLTIRAAAPQAAPASSSGIVIRAGDLVARAELGAEWRSVPVELAPSTEPWRSGHRLELSGYGGVRPRIASVRIERGRTLPSLRLLALTMASSVFVLLGMHFCGSRSVSVLVAPLALSATTFLLLLVSPEVVTPFIPLVAVGCLAAAVWACVVPSFLEALHARSLAPPLPPLALSISALAVLGWFVASASPLYAGGHFGYHTSIAEEIWQGKFWLYYLPEPENMLARQPQWGNLVVPHSSLFHTLSSPFAALPRLAFHAAVKMFLALLLGSMAVTAGLLAASLRNERAAVMAVALVAVLPTGYQLLGLGHLMTLFGCASAAVALGFLILHADRLSEPGFFRGGLALVAICFLSYTGSLLFASAALAFAAVLAWRAERPFALMVAKLLFLGWLLALLLYYGNWVVPFLSETLPALAAGGGQGESLDLSARLLAVPRKFAYSFGSALIPMVALVGVAVATRRTSPPRRALVLGWALVLVAFTGFDLGFNLLLKHHYFSLPLIALGLSLALTSLESRGRAARVGVAVVLLAIALLGAHAALLVARGIS